MALSGWVLGHGDDQMAWWELAHVRVVPADDQVARWDLLGGCWAAGTTIWPFGS